MKNILIQIKENWFLGLILLLVLNWLLGILNEPKGVIILCATFGIYLFGSYLSKKVFHLSRKGPIPWYGSPIFWLAGISLVLVVYVRVTSMS